MRVSEELARALKEYCRDKYQTGESTSISDVTYVQEGISHPTYSFRLEYLNQPAKHSENLILRMGGDRDEVRKEFLALTKLHSTSIPVPRAYHMGEDMLGSAFIIMEKVEGQSMSKAMDGLAEAEQARLWKQLCELLAAIHMLDWEREGFAFLAPPEGKYGYIERWLSTLRQWCKDAGAHDLDPVFGWLEGNKPPSDHYVLLHGDYLPDNVIVCQGEIVAVVDWDGVSVGDPAYDVGWLLLLCTFFEPPGSGLDSLLVDSLRHYKKATGREVRNLEYYQIVRASLLLFFTWMLEVHGARELGAKQQAEMLLHPVFDVPGRCAKFIEEKTGIAIQIRAKP